MSPADPQPPPANAPGNIVLVGYRGSGKTTVGRLLATRIGWDFVDTDACIQQSAACSIREVFAAGEARFRDLETAALAELCGRRCTVIAVGGGALDRAENRVMLKGLGTVVWLRANPQVLHERITADPRSPSSRPDLTNIGGLDEVSFMLAARSPQYAGLAQHEIDTTLLRPDETAAAILAALGWVA